MDETKPATRSLTIIAAAISALLSLLGAAGVAIDPVLAGEAANGVVELASAVLALVAIVGRLRATTRIGRNG
jgi:protein-S-isoprenylcysteine O-methyltransferase Ste14